MSDKVDLIYDLLKTDREELGQFREEVRKAHGDIQERLAKIEILDGIQNEQLAEHIRRTDLLEVLHKENEARIQKLEEPGKALKLIKKWILTVGAIATAVAAIFGLIKFF